MALMTWQYYLTFLSILFVATLSPGPSMLLALNHGVSHGFRVSIISGLGNILGNLLLSLASLAVLQSLHLISNAVFEAVQWGGIGYLIYLGIRTWRSSEADGGWDITGRRRPRNRRLLFTDGFLVAVMNPKGLVFYTALFPQFIRFGKADAAEYLLVFASLMAVGLTGFMLYVVFGMQVRQWFRHPGHRRNFNRISGASFVVAGLAMIMMRR